MFIEADRTAGAPAEAPSRSLAGTTRTDGPRASHPAGLAVMRIHRINIPLLRSACLEFGHLGLCF